MFALKATRAVLAFTQVSGGHSWPDVRLAKNGLVLYGNQIRREGSPETLALCGPGSCQACQGGTVLFVVLGAEQGTIRCLTVHPLVRGQGRNSCRPRLCVSSVTAKQEPNNTADPR